MDEQLFRGDLVGVTWTCFRVKREGFTVTVVRYWEHAPQGAQDVERYSRLTRGECVQLLDDLRLQFNAGTEY